jgi:hypothetical protein
VRPLARGGGHPSGTAVAGSLVRSTREHRAGSPRSLAQGTTGSPLDLAPGGVYRAAAVTCGAGGLLHHRFTLTPADAGAVCFLWHCPAGHPGSALPTTLSCGARTFLTGLAPGATARPTHPCSGYAGCHRPRVANRLGADEHARSGPSAVPPGRLAAPLAAQRSSGSGGRRSAGPGRRTLCGPSVPRWGPRQPVGPIVAVRPDQLHLHPGPAACLHKGRREQLLVLDL